MKQLHFLFQTAEKFSLNIRNLTLILLLCFSSYSFAQTFSLKGKVLDEKGEPLAGATLYMAKLKKGTVTDLNGDYQISGIPLGTYEIVGSFIGFETQNQRVNISGENQTLNFTLTQKELMLEGLVVTAQKREQSVKEIPTAVTSLDAGFLENTGITQLDKLANYIPGVQIQLQSPNNPGFVVRGITSDDGASNIEPRVSVFQDGVSISKSRGSVIEAFDMERIEALKGPQGTLFGRGAQIGAIHFIQNKAQNNTSGALTAGYGDYNYMHFQGFFNTPIVKDKLFFRVAGIYKKHDGVIKNLSGGDLNGKDTKAFRASLRYKPAPMTTIDLIYNYQQDNPPGTSFKSGIYAPAGGDTKPWTFADLDRGNELGLDRVVWGTTLIARHAFSPGFSLTSTTAYREFDSYESFDADGTAAPVLWFAEDAFGKQFSQEFRMNFKLDEKLEGFGGMSYFYEDGFSHVPFETNEQSLAVLLSSLMAESVNTSMLAPINAGLSSYLNTTVDMQMQAVPLLTDGVPNTVSSLSGLISNNAYVPYISAISPVLYALLTQTLNTSHKESYTNYGTNSAYEFFLDGTYSITERLKVTGGIRFTAENIQSGYQATTDPDGNDGTLGFARSSGSNDLFMPTEKITASDSYTSFVGRLALNYSINKNLESYATFARGRRPNVIQFNSVENTDYTSSYETEKLNDEIVMSYELGVKGLSKSQQFYFDMAAFYYDYSDFQTQSIEDLQIVTKDAGDATAYGFETSLKWQANKWLNLFGNYALINASFDDEDSDGNPQEYAGNTFRLTPKHSFSLGTNIVFPVSSVLNAFILPTYNYKSKVYFEEDNTEDIKQDAYGLLNCRAGVELPKRKITILVFVDNILDEKYIIDAGNTGRNFGIPTYIAGLPRMYGFELSIKF